MSDAQQIESVALFELVRTPARDRVSDELLGADHCHETDQYEDRVPAIQTINVVVVHTTSDATYR